MLKNILKLLLISLSSLVYAEGQGVLIEINNYLNKSVYIEIANSNCVDKLDNIPSTELDKFNYFYIEACNKVFNGCLFDNSKIKFNLFTFDNNQKISLADFYLHISANSSRLYNNITNHQYAYTFQHYPHTGIIGDQDKIAITLSKKLNNWMSQIADKITNKSLNQIYLPGTHDTGTYTINSSKSFSPDADSTIVNFGNIVKPTVSKWSKTQFDDIYTQLTNGIRYLDFRICENNQNISLCHALHGESLENSIQQIKLFLQNSANSKELILIDLNHWYPQAYGSEEDLKIKTLDYIYNQLSPWIASREDFNTNSLMNDFWLKNKQVLIFSTDIPDDYKYKYVWQSVNTDHINECNISNIDLCSYWINSEPNNLLNAITNAYDDFNKINPSAIKVLQLQATPTKKTVIKSIIHPLHKPASLVEYTKEYKSLVTDSIRENKLIDYGLIYIEDFTNGIDLTNVAMQKNLH